MLQSSNPHALVKITTGQARERCGFNYLPGAAKKNGANV
jgi:hypothetical protein